MAQRGTQNPPPRDDEPVFVISRAAELAGMHPQTLRQYDRLGLVTPGRSGGGGRRYSPRDVANAFAAMIGRPVRPAVIPRERWEQQYRELGFSAAELTGAFSVSLLVAGVAGIAVGRFLDRHSPRALMTAGSAAGALLVVAWSRVESLWAFYAIWAALGSFAPASVGAAVFTVTSRFFSSGQSSGTSHSSST